MRQIRANRKEKSTQCFQYKKEGGEIGDKPKQTEQKSPPKSFVAKKRVEK